MYLSKALDVEPDLIIDDGGDLVNMLHGERKNLVAKLIGGSEETTTGVHRLKALSNNGKLAFPMIAVNDAYSNIFSIIVMALANLLGMVLCALQTFCCRKNSSRCWLWLVRQRGSNAC